MAIKNQNSHQSKIKRPKMAHTHQAEVDRLSNLPDDMIYHILSFLETRSAVQTCVLSKEWRYHWTGIHSLNFNDITFGRWRDYAKFVRRVLRHRKSFNLRRLGYHCSNRKDKFLVNRIFNYAQKRNLEELETDLCTLPPQLYECSTLKILRFGPNFKVGTSPNAFGFASLITLELVGVCLSSIKQDYDLFSSCVNIKNLLLIDCQMFALEKFNICFVELVNLTLSNIRDCSSGNKNLFISAPKLKFLNFKGRYALVLTTDKCLSLDRVNIEFLLPPINSLEIYNMKQWYISGLIAMVENFCHAKSIESVETLEKFHDAKSVAMVEKFCHATSVTVSFNSSQGKLILHRDCRSLETETTFTEPNKDIGGEWWIDLIQVGQHLSSNGFHTM